jgi:hypothetical protein
LGFSLKKNACFKSFGNFDYGFDFGGVDILGVLAQ